MRKKIIQKNFLLEKTFFTEEKQKYIREIYKRNI